MAQLTLFFDRTFGKRLPFAIHRLRPPVEIKWHQNERFPANMPDDEWLEIAGRNDWVVLTQDRKFHVIDYELHALKQHNVKCFYFPCAMDTAWVTLCNFVRTHKKIIDRAQTNPAPFIYDIKSNGSIKQIQL